MQTDHHQAHQYIGNRHSRHHGTRSRRNALYTTQYHGPHDNHQYDSGDCPRNVKLVAENLRNGIRLHRVSQPKPRHAAKQREGRPKDGIARPKTVADVVHRTAAKPALIVLLAVPNRQDRLRIFHGHAEKRR